MGEKKEKKVLIPAKIKAIFPKKNCTKTTLTYYDG